HRRPRGERLELHSYPSCRRMTQATGTPVTLSTLVGSASVGLLADALRQDLLLVIDKTKSDGRSPFGKIRLNPSFRRSITFASTWRARVHPSISKTFAAFLSKRSCKWVASSLQDTTPP